MDLVPSCDDVCYLSWESARFANELSVHRENCNEVFFFLSWELTCFLNLKILFFLGTGIMRSQTPFSTFVGTTSMLERGTPDCGLIAKLLVCYTRRYSGVLRNSLTFFKPMYLGVVYIDCVFVV